MRRLVNGVLVLSLAVSLTTTTAFAAPRRDIGDGNANPFRKIVQIIKKIVRSFDTIDITYPKP